MGRYLELARRSIGTLHVPVQLPVAVEDVSTRHSCYETNEINERSLSATSAKDALQRDGETVATWIAGVSGLRLLPPPRTYPAPAWQQLIVDAERFLVDWAAQAAALRWPAWELFGCCRDAPWGRIQGMGLILLLHGRQLAALTATEAVIRTRTGVYQTYRRRPRDPLHPAERCLVWELS